MYYFFTENVKSNERKPSDNAEEDDVGKLERERNVIMGSSNHSCKKNDEYKMNNTEELNKEIYL